MKAYEYLVNEKWAMLASWIPLLASIAQRDHDYGAYLAQQAEKEAMLAKQGAPMEQSRNVQIRDGVAIMTIRGPISRYAGLFTDVSGASSTERLSIDFNRLLNNPQVHSIIFDVDSPGGTVKGTHEFADMVYAARDKKRLYAYCGGTMASAAYWIGAATSAIWGDPTALFGSIGVVAIYPKESDDKTIEVVSSQTPDKRIRINTEEGRGKIQKEVDALADVFIQDIAAYRGVAAEQVISDYAQGGVFIGREALAAGMIDQVGSLEGLIKYLSERHNNKKGAMIMAEEQDKLLEALKAQDTERKAMEARYAAQIAEQNTLMQQMRAEIQATKDQNRLQVAQNWTNELLHAGRINPTDMEQLIALHAQAQRDDELNPLASGSRLASLKLLMESRQPQALTQEQIGVNTQTFAMSNSYAAPTQEVDYVAEAQKLMQPKGVITGKAVAGETPLKGDPTKQVIIR